MQNVLQVGYPCWHSIGFTYFHSFLVVSSAVTKGQWSWWVDWVSWLLQCDQRSAELMSWLSKLVAPVWPKVSRADGLTGWAGCSTVTKGQWSLWVDWVSRHHPLSSYINLLLEFSSLSSYVWFGWNSILYYWTHLFTKNRQKCNKKTGETDIYRDKSSKTYKYNYAPTTNAKHCGIYFSSFHLFH